MVIYPVSCTGRMLQNNNVSKLSPGVSPIRHNIYGYSVLSQPMRCRAYLHIAYICAPAMDRMRRTCPNKEDEGKAKT
ncbi:hypothetical protein J6590_019685 [Homalodisca vitripennis]|nr:hypothetical protein J6590_019685 [Homalodisca vitripennis]